MKNFVPLYNERVEKNRRHIEVTSLNDTELRNLAAPLLGKWSLFVIYELVEEPQHFAALERAIPGISRKVLNTTLQDLCHSGIVTKNGESSTGHKVYYSLSPLGESLLPILADIKAWLKAHAAEILECQQQQEIVKKL